MTLQEVADFLHVSRHTVERYIARGELVALKLGAAKRSTVRVQKKALDQFLQGGVHHATET